MRRPVALPGNRWSPLATAGLDRWPSKTELGLQACLRPKRGRFPRFYVLKVKNMRDANQINRDSWDRYQADYMRFQLMARPDYFEFLSSGGVDLDEYLIELSGDVRGLSLLDTCCPRTPSSPSPGTIWGPG